MEASEFFGDVVYAYSRKQACEDGVLVDVTATAREAGIVLPTVTTRAVWDDWVAWPTDAPAVQDVAGRLWDVLYVLSCRLRAAAQAGIKTDRVDFAVNVRGRDGRTRTAQLYALVGPGDAGEPVLTVMEQGES